MLVQLDRLDCKCVCVCIAQQLSVHCTVWAQFETAVVPVIKTTMPTNLTAIKYYPCTCIVNFSRLTHRHFCINTTNNSHRQTHIKRPHQKRTLICRLQHMRWNWFWTCILCIVQIYSHHLPHSVGSLHIFLFLHLFTSPSFTLAIKLFEFTKRN